MKNPLFSIIFVFLVFIALILLKAACYTLQETEMAVITQFGKPVGAPITMAGLHFKVPFIQDVNVLDKRVMEWDGEARQVPTKDKLFINLDVYARWRIKDSLLFFQSLHDEIIAQSRLDDFIDGETRNAIGKHPLIEVIRTDKDRQPIMDESLISSGTQGIELRVINWQPITLGREKIAHEIHENARNRLLELGIELIDFRFRRINYNQEVQQKIYDRMSSERQQIANKFRSEGQGQAARITGEKGRDLKIIESKAYRQIQEIKGHADAEATNIYAKSYNQSPASAGFYQFMKTMETYLNTLDKSTTLILSTSTDLFKYLRRADGAQNAVTTGGK